MWGRHVEASVQMATRKAKTDSQAQSRAQAAIRKLMTDPEAEEETKASAPRKRFADPAERFGKR